MNPDIDQSLSISRQEFSAIHDAVYRYNMVLKNMIQKETDPHSLSELHYEHDLLNIVLPKLAYIRWGAIAPESENIK